jgi:Skp family chaperone for outer membrane proteins
MHIRTAINLSIVTLIAAVGAAAIPIAAVAADGTFAATHPRRDQVNDRLARQNKRIKAEVAAGDLTKAQAGALHADDRKIRREERLMASQNGGDITKLEQRTLNQQENAVSKQVGQ